MNRRLPILAVLALLLVAAVPPSLGATQGLTYVSTALSTNSTMVGHPVGIQANLRNDGSTTLVKTIVYLKPGLGPPLATPVGTLTPGQTLTLSWTYTYDNPGTYHVMVDDVSVGNVTVLAPPVPTPHVVLAGATLEPRNATPGAPLRFSASVTNDGTAAGNLSLTLARDGSVWYTSRVTLLTAGNATTITANLTAPRDLGNYTLTLNGAPFGNLTVATAPPTPPPNGTDGNGNDGGGGTTPPPSDGGSGGNQQMVPGPGVLLTLAAAALASLRWERQRRR